MTVRLVLHILMLCSMAYYGRLATDRRKELPERTYYLGFLLLSATLSDMLLHW